MAHEHNSAFHLQPYVPPIWNKGKHYFKSGHNLYITVNRISYPGGNGRITIRGAEEVSLMPVEAGGGTSCAPVGLVGAGGGTSCAPVGLVGAGGGTSCAPVGLVGA